jgi:hypothetical protein
MVVDSIYQPLPVIVAIRTLAECLPFKPLSKRDSLGSDVAKALASAEVLAYLDSGSKCDIFGG